MIFLHTSNSKIVQSCRTSNSAVSCRAYKRGIHRPYGSSILAVRLLVNLSVESFQSRALKHGFMLTEEEIGTDGSYNRVSRR
jgi:hypothetical protein